MELCNLVVELSICKVEVFRIQSTLSNGFWITGFVELNIYDIEPIVGFV